MKFLVGFALGALAGYALWRLRVTVEEYDPFAVPFGEVVTIDGWEPSFTYAARN